MKHTKQETCVIWLDARAMPNSGIGRYIDILASVSKNLSPECELHAWKDFFSCYTGKRISPFLAVCRFFYEIFLLPFLLKRAHVSIFHCTKNFGLPVFAGCKKILSVHDLIPLDLPEYAGGLSKLYYYWNYRISCYGADKIICSSEFTRKRLLHYFPDAASKTRVVYLGTSQLSSGGNQSEESLTIQKPYILMMGGAEPRKNISFAANCILSDERFHQYDLVIIGSAWHHKVLSENITEDQRVHCMEKISDAKLSGLYRHATAFVFPSVYEGFGLPLFEASASHVPILAANASVMPELLTLPEILFEPNDEKDFCDKLNELLNSETLRDRIQTEMEKLLQKYSWDETVSKTFSIYHELLN